MKTKLLPIPEPNYQKLMTKSNVFDAIIDYVLLESYYIKNPDKEKGFETMAAINLQRKNINTNVLI